MWNEREGESATMAALTAKIEAIEQMARELSDGVRDLSVRIADLGGPAFVGRIQALPIGQTYGRLLLSLDQLRTVLGPTADPSAPREKSPRGSETGDAIRRRAQEAADEEFARRIILKDAEEAERSKKEAAARAQRDEALAKRIREDDLRDLQYLCAICSQEHRVDDIYIVGLPSRHLPCHARPYMAPLRGRLTNADTSSAANACKYRTANHSAMSGWAGATHGRCGLSLCCAERRW